MRKSKPPKMPSNAPKIVPNNATAGVEQYTQMERRLVSLFRELDDECQDFMLCSMEECTKNPLLRRARPALQLVKRGTS